MPTTAASSALACFVLWTSVHSTITYDRGSYVYDDSFPTLGALDDVLPRTLLDAVESIARRATRFEKSRRDSSLKDGKATTFWMERQRFENPKTAIELAISTLARHVGVYDDEKIPGRISGAEWWVQIKSPEDGSISFHFDKDEGIASEERWMKMPYLSSILYVSDVGGPTVVFNQRTDRRGNEKFPPVPEEAFLSFPRRNRYVYFRGNLYHGVVGELSPQRGAKSRGRFSNRNVANERVTLLVNFWDTRPMGIYCNEIPDDILRSWKTHVEFNDLQADLHRNESVAVEVKASELDVSHLVVGVTTSRKMEIRSYAVSRMVFPLPQNIQVETLHYVRWHQNQIMHGVDHLNVRSNLVQRRFFGTPEPKLIVFRHSRLADVIDYDIVFPIASEFGDTFRVFTAIPNDSKDVLRSIGFNTKRFDDEVDVVCVIYDTESGLKYVTTSSDVEGFSKDTLRSFLSAHSTGELVPFRSEI